MRPPRILAAVVLLAAGAGTLPAQSTAPDTGRVARVLGGLRPSVEFSGRPATRWSVAERMANHRVPGVSIAVIEGGRVAWARGVGVKQAGTTDSVTPATLFQAASISKPVAATAMLRLVERGTLDLDADVNRYLTSWKVPENAHTAREKVTLRRIVAHRAGLTVHGFPGYAPTGPIPTTVQVLDGAAPANTRPVRVDTTPGSLTRYAGGGTTVMQQLLVDVTGTPFPALMRELVLGPAGMTRSTYEQPLPASRAAEAARAHGRDGSAVAGGWHVYPEMAAAGLWTTPTDLATWALAIAGARAGTSTGLLSKAMATQMLTAQWERVGLGPMLSGSGRTFGFGHGGANEGMHCDLVYYPELGVGAAIMTNGDNGPLLIREIKRALAAEYGWPEGGARTVQLVAMDAAAMAAFAGEWTLKAGRDLPATIAVRDGGLTFTAPQLPPQELMPTSPSSFVMSGTGWEVAFTRDAAGAPTGFTVTRDAGPPVAGVRAKQP